MSEDAAAVIFGWIEYKFPTEDGARNIGQARAAAEEVAIGGDVSARVEVAVANAVELEEGRLRLRRPTQDEVPIIVVHVRLVNQVSDYVGEPVGGRDASVGVLHPGEPGIGGVVGAKDGPQPKQIGVEAKPQIPRGKRNEEVRAKTGQRVVDGQAERGVDGPAIVEAARRRGRWPKPSAECACF